MLRTIARVLLAMACLTAVLAASAVPGIWLDVPFVKQEKEGCGAASIAMVMQFWRQKQGQPVAEDADAAYIQKVLYSSEGHGIYASALERYFQQRGFRTFAFHGEWGDLKQHLEKGRPLIVALKPRGGAPLHYVVVAGLDWDHQIVMVNDPAQRKLLKQDQSSFEREWSSAGKWTLLALPQS
jgi:ABC-type bacteriocin/lantibiotic exporter with double-glycine peptidase domain